MSELFAMEHPSKENISLKNLNKIFNDMVTAQSLELIL